MEEGTPDIGTSVEAAERLAQEAEAASHTGPGTKSAAAVAAVRWEQTAPKVVIGTDIRRT